jgi:hypothetical protein
MKITNRRNTLIEKDKSLIYIYIYIKFYTLIHALTLLAI